MREPLAELRALLLVELIGLRLRIATGVLRVARVEVERDEARAEALHLLGDHRTRVVGFDDRAEPARRGDRLETRHARADHEHARGLDRARGGHEHREDARQRDGREQHRAIAGEVRLRGERVHRLRARDARDQLECERCGELLGQARGHRGRVERAQKADVDRALAQRRDLRVARRGDLEHEIRGERLGGTRQLRTDRRIARVVEAGRRARSRLHRDLDPALHERLHRVG